MNGRSTPLPAALGIVALLAVSAPAQDLDDLLDDLEVDVAVTERAAAAPAGADGLGLDDLLAGDRRSSADPSGARWFRLTRGFLEIEGTSHLRDRRRGRHDDEIRVLAEVEIDLRLTDAISGYFRPRVLLETLHGEQRRFEPPEGYLTYERDDLDVRAGQFVENWGIVDTFNPIDVLNRRDLGTDPLDPDRLGEVGVRVRRRWTGGDTIAEPTISLYALPVFRRTRFAEDDDRRAFGTAAQPLRAARGFEPDGSEGHFYGARIQAILNTAPIHADTQLVLSRGPDRTPTFQFRRDALVPVYHGVHVVGLGFRGVPNEDALGRFASELTLKAELAYKDAFSFDGAPVAAPDDHLAYVAGVDRVLDGVFRDLDQLTLTAEYAGESGADDPASRLRPFRDDAVLRVLWEGNDFARSSVEFRALIDLEEDERVYELVAQTQLRAIDENLTGFVRLQRFERADRGRTPFSLLPDNSALSIGLRWDF